MVAVVTGGSRGIGRAIVAEFVRDGWQVLAPTRAELDLSDASSIRGWCASLPAEIVVDAIVHSAGVNWPRPIEAVDEPIWQATMQVNVAAALQLVQGLQPRLPGARIVMLGSILGLVSRPHRSAYSASKAALQGLVRAMAVELGPQQTLVNALCPGYVDTDLTRANNSAAQLEAIAATIPLRRLGTPTEVARLAVWLCSRQNTYLTGQSLVIDGGFTCQ